MGTIIDMKAPPVVIYLSNFINLKHLVIGMTSLYNIVGMATFCHI